jgi:hypothetical protein
MWAQIRGRQSSFLIFITLILLPIVLGLSSGFAGIRLGLLLGAEPYKALTFHVIFLILYASSISLTIVLWARSQSVLSETFLRRYPVPPTTRFAARHIIGLLDPVWLAHIILIVGLLIIPVSRHAVAPMNALICAPVFILVSYLSAAAFLALLDRAALRLGGAGLLGIAGFALFSAAGIAAPFLNSPAKILCSRALDFLPPAAAARLLLENSVIAFICYGAILTGWCFLFAGMLKRLESSSPSIAGRDRGRAEAVVARFFARFFGKSWSPLIERSLLYHLRCNRVRVNIGITIPAILFMLHFMDRSHNPAEMLMIRSALLFVSGLFSVSMMMFNAYGYEGGGMARLALCPVPYAATLHCANLASLSLSLVIGSVASLFVAAMNGFPFRFSALLIFLSAAWAGSFFLAALGLFSSVYFPKRAQYDRVFGNDSSSVTHATICAVMFFSFTAAFWLAKVFKTPGPTPFWWAFPMLLALCAYLYILSFKRIGRLLVRRREDLLLNLCGA